MCNRMIVFPVFILQGSMPPLKILCFLEQFYSISCEFVHCLLQSVLQYTNSYVKPQENISHWKRISDHPILQPFGHGHWPMTPTSLHSTGSLHLHCTFIFCLFFFNLAQVVCESFVTLELLISTSIYLVTAYCIDAMGVLQHLACVVIIILVYSMMLSCE